MRTLFGKITRGLVAVALASLTVGGLGGAAYVRSTEALAVTARVTSSFSGSETSALDQGTVTYPASLTYSQAYADGSGSNAANKLWCDTRTSADADPDLAGTLTSGLGATVTFTAIKQIFINTPIGNAGNLLVGGAGANDFINWVGDATDVIVVKPGGHFELGVGGTGYAVTAGTGDILGIGSSSGTATYSICILGVG